MKSRKGVIIRHVYREDTRQAFLGISYPLNGGGRCSSTFDLGLRESASKLRVALVQAGANLIGTKNAQEKMLAMALMDIPDKKLILVDKPGFRSTTAGPGYVLGKTMIGAAKGRYRWLATNANEGIGASEGTLIEWQKRVATLSAKSSYAMFWIFGALAASLDSYVRLEVGKTEGVAPLMTEGVVFNSSGEGSTGKSTLGRLAASVWGSPDYVMEWDFTRRGLEEAAAAHNDGPFVIDDTDKLTETDLTKRVALKLVNQVVPKGQSKAISGRARNEYPQLRWSTFGFSSSLEPFDAEAIKAGFIRSAGEKYRLIDIPVPGQAAGGIFDRIEGTDEYRKNEAASLISKLELGVATSYGVLMSSWVEFLIAERRASRVHMLVMEFVKRIAPNAGGQEGRLAKKFGVIYAAGVLAINAGLLPWSENESMRVVKKLYLLARRSLVSDADLAITRLKTLADASNNQDTFPKHNGQMIEYSETTLGIRTRYDGHGVCCIRDKELGKLAGSKSVKNALQKLLEGAQAIAKAPGAAGTIQHRLPITLDGKVHNRPRFWTIRVDKLIEAATN